MSENGEITLHPEKGVNPRLTTCPRCGGDGPELVLLGIKNYVDICGVCGFKHYGGLNKGQDSCFKCGAGKSQIKRRKLDDWEKVPSASLCQKCEEELEGAKKVVADGGIYWKCDNCRREGVIRADHELSKSVREHAKVMPPLPVGVTLDKEDCPFCRGSN